MGKHFVGIIPPCMSNDYAVVVFDGRGKWDGSAFVPTKELAHREAKRLRRILSKDRRKPHA